MKQHKADDKTLMNHAMRIHARAIRAAGVLLAQIEPKHCVRTDLHREGDRPMLTRESAATGAGLSSKVVSRWRYRGGSTASLNEETTKHLLLKILTCRHFNIPTFFIFLEKTADE